MLSSKVYDLIKMIKRDPLSVTLDEILDELDIILSDAEDMEDKIEELESKILELGVDEKWNFMN